MRVRVVMVHGTIVNGKYGKKTISNFLLLVARIVVKSIINQIVGAKGGVKFKMMNIFPLHFTLNRMASNKRSTNFPP